MEVEIRPNKEGEVSVKTLLVPATIQLKGLILPLSSGYNFFFLIIAFLTSYNQQEFQIG